MKRNQRLRTRADFGHARDRGTRAGTHPLLVLYVVSNEVGRARVGITVSGRVGNAVVRNRVRRRLKEALRACFDRLAPGFDLLLITRPASARATFAELSAALDSVIARSGATLSTPAAVQVAPQHA